MRTIHFFIVLLFINISTGHSQEAGDTYRQKLTEGNYLVLEGNYPRALSNYLEAYNKDSSSCNLNYKIGYCYLKSSSQKSAALPYLKKAIERTTNKYDEHDIFINKAPIEAHLYLGKAYHLNYEFDSAITQYSIYRSLLGGRQLDQIREADRHISMAKNAKEFTSTPVNVKISNMGDSINTTYPDYGPVISADESILIFTSRRTESTGGFKDIDDQYYEDIFVSYRNEFREWSKPVSIGENINTVNNEATIALSADGQQLFIYNSNNGGDIYLSNLDGDKWSVPEPLSNNVNSKYWETHASLSADRNTLYFVSDRPGGIGGRDIYRSVKLPNGDWSLPLNLGPEINTPYDEDAPFIHPDGITLFFSSNGHKSMGGFDIFYSSKKEENGWNEPINVGYPINTPDDDVFYVSSVDGRRAYFSSDRANGKGEKDLYLVTLNDAITNAVTLLKGLVTVNGKTEDLPDVIVTVMDENSGELVQKVKPNSKTGRYVLILSPGEYGKTYSLTYETESFDPITETIEIKTGSEYQQTEAGLELKTINFKRKELGTVALKGFVTDLNKKPIPGTKISVEDNKSGELIETIFSGSLTGDYFLTLKRGRNYNISFSATGYIFQSENIDMPMENTYSEIEKNIILSKPEAGRKIVLNNIFFESGKSSLKKESVIEIEKVLKLLNDNPGMKIEVSGHTDIQGNYDKNMKLSKDRAQAVVNVLVQKGIDRRMLVAKGYGPDKPRATNDTNEGRQMNRRVELKIIESN